MPHCAARRAKNYDNFSCTFDFLPGAALGICPDKRQLKPSILLPFSYLILWHVIISPSAESAVSWIRVLARDSPMASAISVSSFSPCVFRNFNISCIRFGMCIAHVVHRVQAGAYSVAPLPPRIKKIRAYPNTVRFTVRGEPVEPPATYIEPFDKFRANGYFA